MKLSLLNVFYMSIIGKKNTKTRSCKGTPEFTAELQV